MEISATLKDLLKWTRFAGMQQLKSIIVSTLQNDDQRLVYEFSDGENSTREIARIIGLGSKSTVEKYWEKWAKLGIVQPAPKVQGRMQRICSLDELGIEVPKVKKESESQSAHEEEGEPSP